MPYEVTRSIHVPNIQPNSVTTRRITEPSRLPAGRYFDSNYSSIKVTTDRTPDYRPSELTREKRAGLPIRFSSPAEIRVLMPPVVAEDYQRARQRSISPIDKSHSVSSKPTVEF